jgi:DHA1 family tetracycline resistance protein-like MFS transporter
MKKPDNKQFFLIFSFVFLDLLGYSLILPLLPYYASSFGATLTLVGLLGTVNGLGQLIAAPIIGRLSDRYGRRPLLILAVAGTVLGFVILGFANRLWIIFLSRAVDGLLGGNTALARAYITDITEPKDRAKRLGLIGAAFGLGFIIGPVMGGFLSLVGLNVPALVAAFFSIINLVAIIFWLPESLPASERKKMRTNPHTAFNLSNLLDELRRPCVGPLLLIRLFYSFAFTLFQSNFALYAKEVLGLDVLNTGLVLTYVGVLSVMVQGFAIGKLTARYKERQLIIVSIILLAVTLLGWGFTNRTWLLLIILAPIALSAGILNTLLTSQITKAVYKEDVGGTLGLSNSMQTIAQITTPGMGGLILANLGPWALGISSSLFMVFAFISSIGKKTLHSDLDNQNPCYQQASN